MENNSYQNKKTTLHIIFILLSITIGSCYSIESDCDNVIESDFWERASELPQKQNIHSIEVANNGDIWIVTHYTDYTLLFNVYLSTDNGNTWVDKTNGCLNDGFIAISPVNGYLFVNGSNGLFRSTNNGENWVRVTDSVFVGYALIIPSGEIYIIRDTRKSVCYSNDNGDTWIEKICEGLPYNDACWLTLGKDGTLYAGTSSRGVYRSTDGGVTWLPPSNHTTAHINDLTVSDDGSIFAATWDNAVLKSANRGFNWTAINNGINARFAGRIVYNPITNDIFVSTSIGNTYMIYRSINLGASWELTTSGLQNSGGHELAFNPITGQMYAVTTHGVYRSRNYPK